ncbi:PmoA family protein [Akkermansiaceae bacterium]|nr:PmoA family protein [Akkermansiaceae bacterium]
MRFYLFLIFILPLSAQLKLERKETSMRVLDGTRFITEFRTDRQVPCLYPLIGPSGSSVTRHYPFKEGISGEATDHPHHISAWFTHGAVNGHDFWHRVKGAPPSNIVLKSFAKVTADSFTAHLAWEHDGEALLNESRTYKFALSQKELTIDFSSTLTAVADVTFGDTKEGSMAIRLTPTLRLKGKAAKGSIQNSEGHKNGDAWGKRAAWVAYYGPDAEGNATVVTLMDHPKNLRHPTWWHARDYGLLAANPFGQHDFEGKKKQPHLGDYTLKKDASLTQRYRLMIHHGTFDAEQLSKNFNSFSKE